MSLIVNCYYCNNEKTVHIGAQAQLGCEACGSARVVLKTSARFKCVLCGKNFRLPAGRLVQAHHNVDDCRGRSLILLDHDE
ncbi:MAG: hypothetical protein KKB20_30370 [Proteobacteria bacterium]|nr:hypothetical protein [Pseudomonadota bacterium]